MRVCAVEREQPNGAPERDNEELVPLFLSTTKRVTATMMDEDGVQHRVCIMNRGAGAQQSMEAARIAELEQMAATAKRNTRTQGAGSKARMRRGESETSKPKEQLRALTVLVMRQAAT